MILPTKRRVAVEKLAADGYRHVQVLAGGFRRLESKKAARVERGAPIQLPSGRFEIDQAASVVEWMGSNLFNHHLGTVRLGFRQRSHKKRTTSRWPLEHRHDHPAMHGHS